jgi:phosphatidylserine decarboxylase
MKKGYPKSLYRPGSSTTLVIFQKQRIRFSKDLLENQMRTDVSSRFSEGFGRPLVETEVTVRSGIGHACTCDDIATLGDV